MAGSGPVASGWGSAESGTWYLGNVVTGLGFGEQQSVLWSQNSTNIPRGRDAPRNTVEKPKKNTSFEYTSVFKSQHISGRRI